MITSSVWVMGAAGIQQRVFYHYEDTGVDILLLTVQDFVCAFRSATHTAET